MEKKKLLILATLGVIPFTSIQALENYQGPTLDMVSMIKEVTSVELHPETIELIQKMIDGNVLDIKSIDGNEEKARGDSKHLVIDATKVNNSTFYELVKSDKVKEDQNTGYFVVNEGFSAALLAGGAFNSDFLKKMDDEDILGVIQGRMRAGFRHDDLRRYAKHPFVK